MDEGSYASGTSTFPLMGMTIGEMVDRIAAKYPDTDAVVSMHQNIRWTYREFLDQVNTVARGLMGMGVEKGDRVGIWAMNHAEWVVVQFATAKIGAIMVNINPAYRTYELEYALKQSEVSTLIVQGRFKTSDYVGMFYEACPEAFEARPGQDLQREVPVLKERNLPWQHDLQRHVHVGRSPETCGGDHGRRTGTSGASRSRLTIPSTSSTRAGQPGFPRGCPHAPQCPQQRVHHRRGHGLLPRRTGSASRCPSTTASAWCSPTSPASPTARPWSCPGLPSMPRRS